MTSPDIQTARAGLQQDVTAPPDPRWREWYESFAAAVYGYIRFHLSSLDCAEDVTAEVFLKVFRASEQYDPSKGNVGAWIFAIARNTLRDHLRRTRQRRLSFDSLRDLASDAPTPEERLLWCEQVRRILAALTELGERDREIIALRYGSVLKVPVIASLLGISETAVRTRLSRALKRLRRRLES